MSRFGDLVGGKKAAPAPTPAPEPVVEEVVGSPILGEDTTNYDEVIEEEFYESDVSLHDMTKKELEEYGRTVGIELDRRHSKRRLVQELEEYLDNH
jgi:hypothetical protein